ncbi:type IV toxin-antitoxin system AbiEi family antitoxin [Acrocarpospora sp. B8E8]|uniref:type IV toxin-antitoxin system AbiEi family antitoxin domain-containing protein n=1 Tax=Acrocarpospora sp. B8E8 TaxID=3153572 RepID=UPI00325EEFE5
MIRTAIGVPPALARRANQVLRPRDAQDVYAHPRPELARLARTGAAIRLAPGYLALVPRVRLGDPDWRPELEAAALGIAQTDYGRDVVALMGLSAARYHGAIPRALAIAIVAIPKQRPLLNTAVGRVVFSRRDCSLLDVERVDTELTSGWVTTVEQTLLDLATRPGLGGLPEEEVRQAIRQLAARADIASLTELAVAQRRPGALRSLQPLLDQTS